MLSTMNIITDDRILLGADSITLSSNPDKSHRLVFSRCLSLSQNADLIAAAGAHLRVSIGTHRILDVQLEQEQDILQAWNTISSCIDQRLDMK